MKTLKSLQGQAPARTFYNFVGLIIVFSNFFKRMRIGELAKATGIPVETIRWYETKGLMPTAVRSDNNYRVYGEPHLERLRFIRHCRSLDISLEAIAKLLNFDAADKTQAEAVHALIAEQVNAISRRIKELQLLREHLLALALRCHGHKDGEHCGILEGLEADAKDGQCRCGIPETTLELEDIHAVGSQKGLKFDTPAR